MHLSLQTENHKQMETMQSKHRVVLKEAWDRHGDLVMLSESNAKEAEQRLAQEQAASEQKVEKVREAAGVTERMLQEIAKEVVAKDDLIEALSAKLREGECNATEKDEALVELKRHLSNSQAAIETVVARQEAAEAIVAAKELQQTQTKIGAGSSGIEGFQELQQTQDDQNTVDKGVGGVGVDVVPRVGSRLRAELDGDAVGGEVEGVELVLCEVQKSFGVTHLLAVSFDNGVVDKDFLWPDPGVALLRY